MKRTELLGQRMAYRERVHSLGEPLQPVDVVELGASRSNRARVRWLDGDEVGSEAWVPVVRLLARWEEAEALLEDERKWLAAVAASAADWNELVADAVRQVFAIVFPGRFLDLQDRPGEKGLLTIRRFAEAVGDLGLDATFLLGEPGAYVDRVGDYRAPFLAAVRLAQALCRTHAEQVLWELAEEEADFQQTLVTGKHGSQGANHDDGGFDAAWAAEELRMQAPVYALLRVWCGTEAVAPFDETQALRAEVARLRRMLETTAQWLAGAGHPEMAALLHWQLQHPAARPGA